MIRNDKKQTKAKHNGKRQKSEQRPRWLRNTEKRRPGQKPQEKMNRNFNGILQARLYKTKATLGTKALEYASNENRYHNFDVAARILNCTPEQALQGMMLKHIVSVFDLIDQTESAEDKITDALIDEKIGDLINYLILLEGLLTRRIEEQEAEHAK